MANQSAKKNQKSIKATVVYLQVAVFGVILWFVGYNSMKLISEQISIWSYLICAGISLLSYWCYKQILKCWELQLPPQAAQYYIDILFMNCIVHLLDPFTTKIWHIYWIIVAYLVWQGLKWLWDYITPKYQNDDEDEQEGEDAQKRRQKKEKKEKKQKVKYIK